MLLKTGTRSGILDSDTAFIESRECDRLAVKQVAKNSRPWLVISYHFALKLLIS